MVKKDIVAKDAKWGQKMIELKIRFWTDGLAEEPSKILPKHAWASGVVRIKRNEAHGIRPNEPLPFNSLMDLPADIEKVLTGHGIILHSPTRMKKYFRSE